MEQFIENYTKNYPKNVSFLTKLNSSSTMARKDTIRVDRGELETISKDTFYRISNADEILKLFPELDISIQIIVSSIVASNDLIKTSLIYNLPNIVLPSNIKNSCLETIKEYVSREYGLEERLYDIVAEALFLKGAYVEAIIPEASLDDVINQNAVNLEIKQEHFVNISAYNKFRQERNYNSRKEFNIGQYINITNDISVIKDLKSIVKNKNKEWLGNIHTERRILEVKAENADFIKELFKPASAFTEENEVRISNYRSASRQSIGRPLTFQINTDAIIPVYTTSEKSIHMGYYLLVDENGLPITNLKNMMTGNELDISAGDQGDQDSMWSLGSMAFEPNKLREMEEHFSSLLEEQLIKRLQGGTTGSLVSVDSHNELYKVMFFRALKAKRTSIVFLPEELVAYYAYDFRTNGTGKSLVEKVSLLYSIKANLFITKIIATIRNSITNKIVRIKINEEEVDPMGKVHEVIDTVMNSTSSVLNWNLYNPIAIDKMAREMGYSFQIETDDYEITPEIAQESSDYKIPDQELDELITESILLSFGLTMDMVKTGYDPELATTYIGKNLLFCKRILPYINKTGSLLTKHVGKIIKNDANLRSMLKEIILDNRTDLEETLVERYKGINNIKDDVELNIPEDVLVEQILLMIEEELEVTLPSPQLIDSDAELNALKAHMEKVTEIVDSGIPDDALDSELFGGAADQGVKIKNLMKSALILNYVRSNNILPEFNKLIAEDFNKENNLFTDVFTLVGSMLNNYKSCLTDLPELTKDVNNGLQKTLDKLQEAANPEEENEDNENGGDDNGGDDDNEGGEGEGDDFGGDEGDEDPSSLGENDGGMSEELDGKDADQLKDAAINDPEDADKKMNKDADGEKIDDKLDDVDFDTDDDEQKDKKDDKKEDKKDDKKDDKKEDKKEEKDDKKDEK